MHARSLSLCPPRPCLPDALLQRHALVVFVFAGDSGCPPPGRAQNFLIVDLTDAGGANLRSRSCRMQVMAKQAGEPMSCSIMKAAAAEPDAAELLPVDYALPKTMCAPPWTAVAGWLQFRVPRLQSEPREPPFGVLRSGILHP